MHIPVTQIENESRNRYCFSSKWTLSIVRLTPTIFEYLLSFYLVLHLAHYVEVFTHSAQKLDNGFTLRGAVTDTQQFNP